MPRNRIQCTSGKFGCVTKQHGTFECLSENFKCDGRIDCQDTSDETHCTNCSHTLWTCHTRTGNGTFKCISKDWLCDRVKDCQDGSDERHCNTTVFSGVPVEDIPVTKVQTRIPPWRGLKTTPGHMAHRLTEQYESLMAILSSPHGIALVAVVAVLGLVILLAGTVIIIRFRKSARQTKNVSRIGVTMETENKGVVERNEYEVIDDFRPAIQAPGDLKKPDDAKYADINFSSSIANQYQEISKTPTNPDAGYCSLKKEPPEESCILATIVLDQSTSSAKRNSAYAEVSTLTRKNNDKPISALTLTKSELNDTDLDIKQNNIGHSTHDNLQFDACASQFGTGGISSNNYLHPVYVCTSQKQHETLPRDYLHPEKLFKVATKRQTRPRSVVGMWPLS